MEKKFDLIVIGTGGSTAAHKCRKARAQRQNAADLNSRAMKADSRQTDLCAYLSGILLGGLLLNAVFGWWWADPVAAVIMLPIIAKEGVYALRGETCDDCH